MSHELILRPSKAPNQPIAPVEYDQRFQDQFSNALRLYFASIDNFTTSLAGTNGIKFLQAPHIAAQDSTNQYALGNNTPTTVKWDTLDTGSGFTLNLDSSATAEQSGVYKIDYSLQFANTSNLQENVYVWLTVDGVPVPGSSSRFTLAARKSAGVYSYAVAYSSVMFTITGQESVKLYWAAAIAYNPVGPIDGVFIEATPAITTPYIRPSNPSAIGSITFVSRLPA